jgi:hypothetical protein
MSSFIVMPDTGTEFKLDDELGEYVCTHADAYLQPPCCKVAGEGGLYWCGCNGQYTVVCPATDCTGILDHEIETLIERVEYGARTSV